MAFQTLVIGLVMSVEGLNTAIEKNGRFYTSRLSPTGGFIKILQQEQYFCGNYIIIGLIIYVPRIF
jgi:diacylglycerol kinase (ATP)